MIPIAVHDTGSSPSIELVAWIIIPVSIFLLGALVAAIKGVISFTRYLVKSQESQDSTAATNLEIRDNLRQYIAANDRRVQLVEQDVAVLKSHIPNTNNNSSRGH